MSKKVSPRLRSTKDYGMFVQSRVNRPVNMAKHKALGESMENYGFLPMYPIHARPTAGGKYEIVDGQHRFAFAQKLGLPVWFVTGDENVNVADINKGQTPWHLKDYAMCFAEMGKKDYQEVLDFTEQYSIPISDAAALLSGTICHSNVRSDYLSGNFKVKTSEMAHRVASVYQAILAINSKVRNSRLLQAVYAVCYIPGFDVGRLTHNVRRCPEKLLKFSTREAYLVMLEDIYNYGRRNRESVKIPAENIMRERSAC
jgi:hypothetical protein